MREPHPDTLDRLQQAFSSDAWEVGPKECPGHEMLWDSAAELLNHVDDEAVLLHLAQCPQCSSIWRMAREMMSREETTTETVVGFPGFKWMKASPKRAVMAIAATVVIGVGLGAGLFLNRGNPAPPVYREQRDEDGIAVLGGTAEMPRTACLFRWTPGPEGTLYDLVITDEKLNVLLSVKGLGESEYLLPEEDLPPATREVFWRVTAHLPNGVVTSSKTFGTRIIQQRKAPSPPQQ